MTEIKMLLKLGLLGHKYHQPCDMESFSESLVGSAFALCPEATLVLCSVWLSPGHYSEGQGKCSRHPVFSPGKRINILSLLLFHLHPSLTVVGQGMTVLRLKYLVNSVMKSGLCSAVQIWHQTFPCLLLQMTIYVGDMDNRLSIDRFCVRSALILLLDSFSRVGDWCGWFDGILYFAVISQKQGAQMQFLI